ncbi:hypothetical protein JKF63_00900 [Porcisia hertigi]|uniref:Nuclear pore complex NUP2/50/61 domain-containing protein n=1 Tax=Porcisia hertigi TaxID=2761500 RepID=A0A836L7E8_9TRYP|nr:hypothetical protein JKF63_00900 [Porcisia hertigi]
MSEGLRKRFAGDQLTRDDDGESRADEEFLTTPQVADESEMATRRVVRVRRTDRGSSSSAFANTPSLFKDVAVASDKEPPAFKVSFGAGSVVKGTAVGGSPAALASSSTQPTSSLVHPPATTPTAFRFGGNATAPATAESSKTPTISFPLGASTTDSGNGSTKMGSSFFGSTSASSGTASSSAGGLSFGFGSAGIPSATKTDEPPSKEPAPAVSTAMAEPKAPVFGAGSFNFGSAVNSFVEARKKIQEEKHDQISEADGGGDDNSDKAPKDDADGSGFGSEIVEQAARNVLATAPSKLFVFAKGDGDAPGRWVERGIGEAKIIAEEKKTEAGVHVHRLLVRGGYALNATVGKNLFTLSKTEAKHLILAVATSEGPHTYLLKFTGPNAEANTKKFSEAIKQIMEEPEKAG